MTRYHVNPETGEVGVCSAAEGQCPFRTFDDRNAATAYGQEMLSEHYAVLSTARRNNDLDRLVSGNLKLSQGLENVIEILAEHDAKPYVVGGAVRDAVAGGVPSKDIDLEVHGIEMDAMISLLRGRGYHVDEVGVQFGVLKVQKDGRNGVSDLDVAIPRRENRVGAGHRDFKVETDAGMTVEEAVQRRDFTFNAIMFDPLEGKVIDPSGGVEDLKSHVMRAVSPRFAEDPLRVLRGFQLAGRFGLHYDEGTAGLARSLRPEYDSIPIERVREEWHKMFSRSRYPMDSVRALQDSGWDDTVKGLRPALRDGKVLHALSELPKIGKQDRDVFGAAAIMSAVEEDDRFPMAKVMLPSKDVERRGRSLASERPSHCASAYDVKMCAYKYERSDFTWRDYGRLGELLQDGRRIEAARLAERHGVLERPEPALLNGEDVKAAFPERPLGKWVGLALKSSLEAQYRGTVRNRDEALALLRSSQSS